MKKKCSIEGCLKVVLCRDVCLSHYNRLYRFNETKHNKKCVTEGCNGRTYKYDLCNLCRLNRRPVKKEIMTSRISEYIVETRLVLTKWKWGFIDEFLYYRTISLYLDIFGWNRSMETISSPYELIEFVLKEIKREYESTKNKTYHM